MVSKKPLSSSKWIQRSLGLTGTAAAAFLVYALATKTNVGQETQKDPEVKDIASIAEDSSKYVQRMKCLESPGVYLWGSNLYGVVDPDSKQTVVKTPRRMAYFDGQVLRDIKLSEKSGAAITDKGDLVQWGKGYSEPDFKPTRTLTGKNLVSLSMSQDRIVALSSNGNVYSLPTPKQEQESGRKPRESSWVPFWAAHASVSYRLLKPSLKLGEKVTALSGGLEHVLLLTNYGRVFSAASSTESYPSRGQLGIPGLTWKTRPDGPVDACHEITSLKNSKIIQIAAGDYHSVALSKDGRIFTFGQNSLGQLGREFNPDSPFNDTPTEVPLDKLYRRKFWEPKATGIAAGGTNSFFTVDAKRILGRDEDPSTTPGLGRVTADTWACGKGISGVLGTGRWVHLQDDPTKVKALSGLFEFDERANKLVPIRLRELSVGSTHASAVLGNSSQFNAPTQSSLDDGNTSGLDVLWWGGNEYFQLGTGKRNNLPRPTYIKVPAEPEGNDNSSQEARLQVLPRHKGKVNNRNVDMEQRVECGKYVSAIYSAK